MTIPAPTHDAPGPMAGQLVDCPSCVEAVDFGFGNAEDLQQIVHPPRWTPDTDEAWHCDQCWEVLEENRRQRALDRAEYLADRPR